MVTGVCTVDLALFVVAADDGVMPQTREHLGILNLLGVPRGIVVLTKVDLVEEEWLELVEEELREVFAETFLEDAPIVPVSSITGEGIDALRTRRLRRRSQGLRRGQIRAFFACPLIALFLCRDLGLW